MANLIDILVAVASVACGIGSIIAARYALKHKAEIKREARVRRQLGA